MSHCWICREPVLKGDSIVVIAFPVECTEDGGDYSFLGDFSKREKLLHVECFQSKAQGLTDILLGKRTTATTISSSVIKPNFSGRPMSIICKELTECLVNLGEDISMMDVREFVSKNSDLSGDTEKLVDAWFRTRNKL